MDSSIVDNVFERTFSSEKEAYNAAHLSLPPTIEHVPWDQLSTTQQNDWSRRMTIIPRPLRSRALAPVDISDVTDDEWICFTSKLRVDRNKHPLEILKSCVAKTAKLGNSDDWDGFAAAYYKFYDEGLDIINDTVAVFVDRSPNEKFYHYDLNLDRMLHYLDTPGEFESPQHAHNTYDPHTPFADLPTDHKQGWRRLHKDNRQKHNITLTSTHTTTVDTRPQTYTHVAACTLAVAY